MYIVGGQRGQLFELVNVLWVGHVERKERRERSRIVTIIRPPANQESRLDRALKLAVYGLGS